MANLGITRVGLKVQNRSVWEELREWRSDFLTLFVPETFDRRKNQPEEEEAHGNMWRRQLAACESEGSGRNQSESLAASRGELLIPISGELVRRAKKKKKQKTHHWNKNSCKGNGNDRPQL